MCDYYKKKIKITDLLPRCLRLYIDDELPFISLNLCTYFHVLSLALYVIFRCVLYLLLCFMAFSFFVSLACGHVFARKMSLLHCA